MKRFVLFGTLPVLLLALAQLVALRMLAASDPIEALAVRHHVPTLLWAAVAYASRLSLLGLAPGWLFALALAAASRSK